MNSVSIIVAVAVHYLVGVCCVAAYFPKLCILLGICLKLSVAKFGSSCSAPGWFTVLKEAVYSFAAIEVGTLVVWAVIEKATKYLTSTLLKTLGAHIMNMDKENLMMNILALAFLIQVSISSAITSSSCRELFNMKACPKPSRPNTPKNTTFRPCSCDKDESADKTYTVVVSKRIRSRSRSQGRKSGKKTC